jgi:hypothetical protein
MAPSVFLLPGQQAAGLYPRTFTNRPPSRDLRNSRPDGRQQVKESGNGTRHYSAQDARGTREAYPLEQECNASHRAPDVQHQPFHRFTQQVNICSTPPRSKQAFHTTTGVDPTSEASHPFHNEHWANSWTMGALTTIAPNSVEHWPSLLHTSTEIEIDEAAEQIQELKYFSLLCYFTDCPPCLPAFRDWVQTEMTHGRGWPVKQVKFTGKNFFLIVFEESLHRDAARDCAPWFMDGRFVYTFEWTPEFNVRTESYTMLPVWIKIPFRTLILERSKSV